MFDAAGADRQARSGVQHASAKCPACVIPDDVVGSRARSNRIQAETNPADRARSAGRPRQHRHRWRHEPGVRRKLCRWQYRAVGRAARARAGAGFGPRARHASLDGQSPRGSVKTPPDEPLAASRWAGTGPPRHQGSPRPTAQSDGFFSGETSPARSGSAAPRHHWRTAAGSRPNRRVVEGHGTMLRRARRPSPAKAEASSAHRIKQAADRPPLKPSLSRFVRPTGPRRERQAGRRLQPIVPANSFDSRFCAANRHSQRICHRPR